MEKKYSIIYADPPWPIRWIGGKTLGISPLEYPTMPVSEIGLLPIKAIADDHSRLFLWTTNAFLPEALGIVRLWGFHYDKLWTWCKPSNMGGHPRNATEHVIEATRGSLTQALTRNDSATNNWFTAARGRHSVKPSNVRDFIERAYPTANKIELFAREKSPGWDTWGNEVPNDVELTS